VGQWCKDSYSFFTIGNATANSAHSSCSYSFSFTSYEYWRRGKEQIWNLFSMVRNERYYCCSLLPSVPNCQQLCEVGAESLKGCYRMRDVADFAKNLRATLLIEGFRLTTTHFQPRSVSPGSTFKYCKSQKTRINKEDLAVLLTLAGSMQPLYSSYRQSIYLPHREQKD